MRWPDVLARPTDRKLREFAAAAAIMCAVFAFWNGYQGNLAWMMALAVLAIAVTIIGIRRPRLLAPLFTIAMLATFPIAWAVSWLVLAVLFYGVVTPLGLLLRLLRRDPLKRTIAPNQDSYWEAKSAADSTRRHLRQY